MVGSNGSCREIVDFPVVVKPGCSLVKDGRRWTKTSVCYAESPEELLRLYRERPYLQQPSLIQQRVIGEGQGLFVLMQEGDTIGDVCSPATSRATSIRRSERVAREYCLAQSHG
jgi:hypothetical protein